MERVEVAVIGAGVVGLAIARRLSMLGKEVLILERCNSFGMGTSSRNSEVVHGGLYYPTGSLKAKFCVQGRKLLYEYCRERNNAIFCSDTLGKLIVATHPNQLPTLRALLDQSHRNGYTDVQLLLSQNEIRALEPNVRANGGAALWSPHTGIVDSHQLMLHFLGDAQTHGASVAFSTAVQHARISIGDSTSADAAPAAPAQRNHGVQIQADGMWLACQHVINCAGLYASEVADLFHTDEKSSNWKPPKQYFAKGNYFRLSGIASPFRHLIYPVPDDARGGLGVHATLDANHQVKFGPDVEWLDIHTHPDQIDYTPNAAREKEFYHSIRSYWPDLPDGALVPDYAGVRPKLVHPQFHATTTTTTTNNNNSHNNNNKKLPFQDFVIAGPKQHGIPGLFHLLGIESPGLTSSLAIAEHVAQRVMNE